MNWRDWLTKVWWVGSRGIPIVVLSIVITWQRNETVRVGILTIGIAAILDWISWRYNTYVARPVEHWLEDQRYATLLRREGFSFDQIVKAIWIERMTAEVMIGSRLVFIGANGWLVSPHLSRMWQRVSRGPLFMATLMGGLTLKNYQDEVGMLEAKFGCPIEVPSGTEPFVHLQFCLRDAVDSRTLNVDIMEGNIVHRQFRKSVELSQRLLFHLRLPLLIARCGKQEATDE